MLDSVILLYTTMVKKTYTASDIEILKGIEPVQKRPGMYTDTSTPNHLLQEVLDNCVDESIAGFCNNIDITLNTDGSYTVKDDGRGMPVDIHPEYKEVVFQDVQSDFKFLTRSTMSSKEKIKWEDGKEYPLIKVEVSSASHPFYTGKKIFVDTAGRVEKFNQKYKAKQAVKPAAPETKPADEEKPVENIQETEKLETPESVDDKETTEEAPAAEETTEEGEDSKEN